jgi:hypothetical protein
MPGIVRGVIWDREFKNTSPAELERQANAGSAPAEHELCQRLAEQKRALHAKWMDLAAGAKAAALDLAESEASPEEAAALAASRAAVAALTARVQSLTAAQARLQPGPAARAAEAVLKEEPQDQLRSPAASLNRMRDAELGLTPASPGDARAALVAAGLARLIKETSAALEAAEDALRSCLAGLRERAELRAAEAFVTEDVCP